MSKNYEFYKDTPEHPAFSDYSPSVYADEEAEAALKLVGAGV